MCLQDIPLYQAPVCSGLLYSRRRKGAGRRRLKWRKKKGALVAGDIRVRSYARRPLFQSRFKDVRPVLPRKVHEFGLDVPEVFSTDPLDVVPVPFPLATARSGLFVERVPIPHEDRFDVVALFQEEASCNAAVDAA